MADMDMLEVNEELAENPVVTEEETDEFADLRASIADLEEKEALLSEKLCLAKEKGLMAQAERCRELLQKAVLQRLRLQDELKEAEAQKLAAELDALTGELGEVLDPAPISEEVIEEEYNHMAKSKRLSLVSRAIGFIGVFASLVGALVYMILTMPETLNLPFDWLCLAIVGVAAVAFIIIAMLIGASANSHRRIAEEMEAERIELEQALAAQAEYEKLALEQLEAATEAYAIETKLDLEKAMPEAPAEPEKKPLLNLPEIPEAVKENVHKIMPVAAACAAAVAAVAIVSAQKRSAEAKRASATRKEFFKWLG